MMAGRKSLEDMIGAADNAMSLLRNSRIGAYVYPVVAGAFSNWREEQRPGARPPYCSTSPITWWTCSSRDRTRFA